MNRNTFRAARAIAAITLALGAPYAFADDGSMSPLTGESYAYFHDLDYNPGGFNTPRKAPARPGKTDAAKAPQTGREAAATTPANAGGAVVETPRKTRDAAERPILLADRPRVTLPSPFRDDQGA